MILGIIAPKDKHVNLRMSSGNEYTGHFIEHSFPFSKFSCDGEPINQAGDLGEPTIIYVQLDNISELYLVEV